MISDHRIYLSLVSETNKGFINQAKLCLYSFRKNAGLLKDIPILFITNDNPLSEEDKNFFIKNFSPIYFIVRDRLNITPHASKLNVFDSLEPSEYDYIIFMDCDTVVLNPLDDMLTPILNGDCQFLCRRGGKTDREAFRDIEYSRKILGCDESKTMVEFEGNLEYPQFNTGVFIFTPDIAKNVGRFAIDTIPKILNKQHLVHIWAAEQCSVAYSCMKNEVTVKYLDEKYNSWGNIEDIRILHCFKSRYKFNRWTMFEDFDTWKHDHTEIVGERMLVDVVKQYKEEMCI